MTEAAASASPAFFPQASAPAKTASPAAAGDDAFLKSAIVRKSRRVVRHDHHEIDPLGTHAFAILREGIKTRAIGIEQQGPSSCAGSNGG